MRLFAAAGGYPCEDVRGGEVLEEDFLVHKRWMP
jgi:hypothetical protein